MVNNIFKASAGVLTLIGLLAMPSCADNDEMTAVVAEGPEMSLILNGLPAATAATSESGQDALSVFQFGADNLFSKSVITSYDPMSISLVKGTTQTLYCVSGIEVSATDATTARQFAVTTVSTAEGENSAPLFLSAWAAVDATQMNCELTMRRGVARIDVDSRDADMTITSITVEDAPASSYVFAGDAGKLADAGSAVYTHVMGTEYAAVEKGMFMLFECDREVHINVHGKVDGRVVTVPATIPSVERNKVYTLRVYENNATVKAVFTMADWEDGGEVSVNPDVAGRLCFDMANSVFPEGVTVDYANNVIEVPGTGISGMKIAFNTDLRVEVDSIYFTGDCVEVDSIKEKHVNINIGKAVNTPTGVVTTVAVDIDGQLKGRPGYEVKMDLRKMNMSMSYDNLTIRVAESPYQIQTVEMAGVTWMAFNAVSPDLSEQVYPADGLTVEETYQQHWAQSIGNFFQYGRQKGYSPWEKNDPNGNEETARNIPWTNPDCMPLPEGYHVSTAAEWLKLVPAGTVIPSTYIAQNGEEIKAELIVLPGTLDDSPSAAANKAKLQKRYIRFESMVTHNVLIIPICALKGPAMDEYPGGGKTMHDWVSFWIAEDRYIWLFQVANSNGTLSVSQGRNRWNYNGFVPVRGVKD